jgi:hypothetical protein
MRNASNGVPLRLALTLLFILVASTVYAAPPLPGAIFTTTADGSIVNANVQYQSKCDVYLDGGPGPNAPIGAAGLPAGDYYFQVTDPSGKKLLSTDPVSNRRFTVSADGIIVAYTGSGGPAHPTGLDQDHQAQGAITIQLANITCPTDFLDTPNNGGVYKAWVTPVGDGTLAGGGFVGNPSLVDNPCGNGCFHGFLPARSKTDNFKVKGAKTATFCLQVEKFIRDSKGGETQVDGWEITVTDSINVSNNYFTDTKDACLVPDLVAGSYVVTESLTFNGGTYIVVGLTVNGQVLAPSSTYSFNWTAGKPQPVIVFTNELAK